MKQFYRYCICGGFGVSSDYLFFLFLLNLGIDFQIGNAMAYIFGTLVSFVLNRHFTFAVYDHTARRLVAFLSTASLGLLVSTALLWIFVNHFDIDPAIAKLGTLPVVVALQFGLNRYITFSISKTRTISIDERKYR